MMPARAWGFSDVLALLAVAGVWACTPRAATAAPAGAPVDPQEQACYQRFAVNACLEALRAEKAEAAAQRRRAALAADRARREQEGTARAEALARREQARAQRLAQEAPQPRQGLSAAVASAPRAAAAAAAAAPREAAPRRPPDSAAHRAQHAQRLEEARKARERVAQRLKAKSGKEVAPLPVPP